jgi:pyridoxal phosphate enzyme (YggS family)
MSSLAARLVEIQDRIARACEVVGRDPAEVCLIAVSKTYPRSAVLAAYDLGLRHFGESRLQEALPKQEGLPDDIVWHFIGPLQSNKAKRAAQAFHVIHSLSSKAQLDEIAKSGSTIEGLLQVNLGREQQKFGIFGETLDAALQDVLHCTSVRFRGLMTIGPQVENPEEARPIFRRLAELGREVGADWLSMGMSGDFEVAIQEGASHVRIGSALFGR